MDDCSKDFINCLPDNLLCQILSNLSTKEAALTSLLSKRWRYLFALVPNLDFSCLHPEDHTSFIDFVDRVIKLRGNDHVNKFSLKCGDGFEDEDIFPWISNVLRHGVSELVLHASPSLVYWLPSKLFSSKTLVKLEIGPESGGPTVKIKNVCLPKLKILKLGSAEFEEGEIGFAKLLSGCPVLEELSLPSLAWNSWSSFSVSSKILKRLTLSCADIENPKSVSFDTPNVVYLEYNDYLAHKYPKVNLDSLVEARIGITMTMLGDATVFLMGICNVKTLYLSVDTLQTITYCCEAITFCCEAIPVYNNLTHLTIESTADVPWDALPNLLKNCPNLETLVFSGLLHEPTDGCGDVCWCGWDKPSCLSSSPVKFLKILKFGEARFEAEKLEWEMDLIKHFLKNMPCLEQLIIHYDTSSNDDLVAVSSQIHMFPEVASINCKIHVISDKLCSSLL